MGRACGADTTKTPGQHHIHYTGPGAVIRDFTLKVEVKLSATGANGGIQYRSRLLHPAHGGSIADLGMLLPGNCKILLGKLPGDATVGIKPHQGLDGEWQQIEIIVRGNTMTHMINGQVMSITVDDDPVARAPQGILSLQLEGSGQIWYRNVYLKPQDKALDFPR
jgi:hypothetical protein